MREIGGYFELELSIGEHFHKDALRLNTARNCFEYILRAKNYTKVYIPYYTCEVLLEPLIKLNVQFEFYRINEQLEPIKQENLQCNEAFLYTNYFGLKQETVRHLATIYNTQLIVDNAQAFYAPPIAGVDTFYSARKFFGVPDGAYLYTESIIEVSAQDVSYQRMEHLLKRIDLGASAGYKEFQSNDKALIDQPVKKMSRLTEAILTSIDYSKAKIQRLKNYKVLSSSLQKYNKLHFSIGENDVPMIYLFYSNKPILKTQLIKNNIFVATYWQNVLNWTAADDLEYKLANNSISIPLDHRYNQLDMENILGVITPMINE